MNIKLTGWTVTTDGDNCPLMTTVHATLAEACKRVRDDLVSHYANGPLGRDVSVPKDASSEDLQALWELHVGGACIIQSHEVEFDVPADWESEYDPNSSSAKAQSRECWVKLTYRTRAGSLGTWSGAYTAVDDADARAKAEFDFRKKHRGEIEDVRITWRRA